MSNEHWRPAEPGCPGDLGQLGRGAEVALERGRGDRYHVLAREPSLDPRMVERQEAVARPLLAVVQRGVVAPAR